MKEKIRFLGPVILGAFLILVIMSDLIFFPDPVAVKQAGEWHWEILTFDVRTYRYLIWAILPFPLQLVLGSLFSNWQGDRGISVISGLVVIFCTLAAVIYAAILYRTGNVLTLFRIHILLFFMIIGKACVLFFYTPPKENEKPRIGDHELTETERGALGFLIFVVLIALMKAIFDWARI